MASKNYYYVGVLDLAMLTFLRGRQLRCSFFESAEKMAVTDVMAMFRQYLPSGLRLVSEDETGQPSPDSDEIWHVIGVSASFKRTNYSSINHFVPAWHKDQLGEALWNLAWAQQDMKITDQKAQITLAVMNLSKSDGESEEALLNSLLEQQERLDAQEVFLTECKSLSLFPEDVEGLGNCGLLSLLALERGRPQCLLDEDQRGLPERWVANMRKELGWVCLGQVFFNDNEKICSAQRCM
eukprot:Skav227135  [mRNA]  locus=scaffold133:277036:277752:- [translate_table: standard]